MKSHDQLLFCQDNLAVLVLARIHLGFYGNGLSKHFHGNKTNFVKRR